jgi:hypothetical protein
VQIFLPIPAYSKFHCRECYNRFCNKQKLEREERRQAVRDENAKKERDDCGIVQNIVVFY